MKSNSLGRAAFNHPQGMAFDGNTLFVADTENHSLRAVDFGKRTVTTIAGTGQQSREHLTFGGQGKQIALNSPWDPALHNGMLYIAMAGPHQLWRMNPKTGGIAPYAGTGREARIDGRPVTGRPYIMASVSCKSLIGPVTSRLCRFVHDATSARRSEPAPRSGRLYARCVAHASERSSWLVLKLAHTCRTLACGPVSATHN